MYHVRWFRTGVVVLALAAVAWQPQSATASGTGADQVVVVDQVGLPGTGVGRTQHTVRAERGTVPRNAAPKPDSAAAKPQRGPVVSPHLRTLMRDEGSGTVKVMVAVADNVVIPEFPAKLPGESAAVAATRQAQAQRLVDGIEDQREPANRRWRETVARLGGRIVKDFWLTQGFTAELPVSAVDALAADPDVLSVESAETITPPPDGDAANDLSVARSLMGTDVYRSFGTSTDTIALIDTGVNSHVLLPSGGVTVTDMLGRNPAVTTDICDHGTRSTTAMVGTNALGNAVRGITNMSLRMYQVGVFFKKPDGTTGCGTDPTAVQDALGQAVQDGFKVIVSETQLIATPDSTLDKAADNAFRSGAVVVGATGNFGGGANSVRAPGNARNVLGIGSVDVETFIPDSPQGHGPTEDGRIKPDLVTPTNYEAGRGTSTTATDLFTGTSGATAAAGGTAAALRAFLKGSNATIEPGRVYAGLIAGGGHPFPFDNGEGAGKLKLPNTGVISTFKVTISPGSSVDVPVDLAASSCRLTGALWWPAQASGPTNADNDVDMDLINPSGQIVATSASGPSVFELARVSSTAGGRWKVRVRSFDMDSSQVVYGALTTCR